MHARVEKVSNALYWCGYLRFRSHFRSDLENFRSGVALRAGTLATDWLSAALFLSSHWLLRVILLASHW